MPTVWATPGISRARRECSAMRASLTSKGIGDADVATGAMPRRNHHRLPPHVRVVVVQRTGS